MWVDFLRHLHIGQVECHHLSMLQGLVVDAAKCPETDFLSSPWNEAVLVMPRHGVWNHWNESAVWKHCRENQSMLIRNVATD